MLVGCNRCDMPPGEIELSPDLRTEDDNWKNLTNLIIVTQDDDHDGDDLRHSYHYHVIVMETMIEMMGMIWGWRSKLVERDNETTFQGER